MKVKLRLLVILLFSFCAARAQNWGGGVDDENIHFGFTFQSTSSLFRVKKNENWRKPFPNPDHPETEKPLTDSLSALYGKPSPGFGIGFVVNGRLSDNMDVRLTPTLVFSNRIMTYEYVQPGLLGLSPVDKKVQASMVEFPLGIKIKSNRRNNFRAYMLYGAKYSIDIASKKKTDDGAFGDLDKYLKNRKSYFSYEAALGMDLYFEYFKMSPEIKWSYSLNDILDNKVPNAYNAPIDRLMLRHVTFSLFFE